MKNLIKIIIYAVILLILFKGYKLVSNMVEPVKEVEFRLTSVTVKEIIQNPLEYDIVTVSGRVKNSTNILGVKFYILVDLDNPEYELFVKPKGRFVPNNSKLIKIKGKVKQFLKVKNKEIITLQEI